MYAYNNVKSNVTRVHGGLRTNQISHDWVEGFATALSENAADVTLWLAFADRMEEAGELAYHAIRWMFTEGYTLPQGYTFNIDRGSRYWENGQMYDEHLGFECLDTGELKHSYWANGMWTRTVTKAEAIEMITRNGGTRCPRWTDFSLIAHQPATRAWLEIGTVVEVSRMKDGKAVNGLVKHTITEIIPVPLEACIGAEIASFEFMGRTVNAKRKDIKLGV